MKIPVLLIGGGTTFDNYDEYLKALKEREIDLDRLRPQLTWKNYFQKHLGTKYDLLYPEMPNRRSAQYIEWAILFEKILKELPEELIIIGHSLGGIFLAKYFAENSTDKHVKKLILLAPPFDGDLNESLGSFVLPQDISNIEQQVEKIILIGSTDDPVVPFSHIEKYKDALPSSVLHKFEDQGHFVAQEAFPELVEIVKG